VLSVSGVLLALYQRNTSSSKHARFLARVIFPYAALFGVVIDIFRLA